MRRERAARAPESAALTPSAGIPPAVAALLRAHVETYEQLEVLLAMHRAPDRAWHADTLAAELRARPELIAAALDGLVASGLVTGSRSGLRAEYRYAPARAEDAASVDGLAEVYATQRLELVKTMSTNAIERVRAAAARTFADAFVLKGRRDDG